MSFPAQIYVANDNDPPTRAPLGDAVGFRALVADRQREFHARQYELELKKDVGVWRIFRSLKLAVLVWIGALVGAVTIGVSDAPPGYKLLGWMAAIWSGLWLSFVATDFKKPTLSEWALLSAIAGFSALMVTAITHFGLPISIPAGLIFFAVATLVISALLEARIALIASIGAVLIWAGLYFDGLIDLGPVFVAVPLLLIGQGALAFRQDSSLALTLCTLACYAWLGGLGYQTYLSGHMSPLYLLVGVFLFATLHYRMAKAAEDRNLPSMAWHIGMGWAIGSLSLLGLQMFLISPDDFIWSTAFENAPLIKAIWAGFAVSMIALIALAGLVRRHHARMFVSSIFLMTLCAAIVPVALWYPEIAQSEFEKATLMPAFPAFLAIIAGTVLASALFFTLNCLRRGRFMMSVVGIIIAVLQAHLLIGSDLLWGDNLALLGVSFVVSLCVITMLGHVNETGTYDLTIRDFQAVRS